MEERLLACREWSEGRFSSRKEDMDCRGDWREVIVPSEAPSGLREGVGMPQSLSEADFVGVFELDRLGISGLTAGRPS